MIVSKQRLLYLDKLRAFAMIMVVMGHIIYFCIYHEKQTDDVIFRLICTFHVPLFFFLSGIVISELPDNNKLFIKVRKFIIPMFVVGIINAIFINKVKDFFINGGHNGYWYLLTLSIFYILLMPFHINKCKKKLFSFSLDIVISLSIWLSLYLLTKLNYTKFDSLNFWGAYAFWPFFILRYIFRKYNFLNYITNNKIVTILSVTLYFLLIITLFQKLNNLPIVLDFTIAIVAIIALIGIFYKYKDNITWIDNQLILIGNNTLYIYIYHYFIIRVLNLDFLKSQSLVTEFLIICFITVLIIYLSIAFHLFTQKIRTFTFLFLSFFSLQSLADNYDNNNYKPENVDVTIDETNLPIVFINTNSKIIHKDYRIAVRMKIINNPNGINYGDTITHSKQSVDYEGWIGIKYRGNSSFTESPKKPYGFKTYKTQDITGEKDKVSIMGIPADNDWILLAPYNDRSMIRDVLMFQLARPYFEFTPKARHCEVIVDGIYYGVYVMTERVSKSKNRLNLKDPGSNGDALTGGYQLEIDRNDENYWYTSKHYAVDSNGKTYSQYYKIHFLYKHPEYNDMMPDFPEQLEYIHNQIDLMEDVLASENFMDENNGYRKYLDPLSFIDQQLSQEFSNNIDGYRLSTNIYKHRDSVDPRFKTALWDFNIAFGNADYCGAYLTDFWSFQNTYLTATNAYQKVPFWWMRLMEDPAYVIKLKNRWAQYREGFYSDQHINMTIDSLVNHLDIKGARKRNYQAWPLWNKKVWPVPNYQSVNSWEKEIDYLKSWIKERVEWMDEQLDYVPDNKNIIDNITDNFNKKIIGYYDLQGKNLNKPQKGLIIIHYNDGSTSKILIK